MLFLPAAYKQCAIMTTQNNVFVNASPSFAVFTNEQIDIHQLSFIKGGEDLDGDGIDDEGNGYIGTEDIIGF